MFCGTTVTAVAISSLMSANPRTTTPYHSAGDAERRTPNVERWQCSLVIACVRIVPLEQIEVFSLAVGFATFKMREEVVNQCIERHA